MPNTPINTNNPNIDEKIDITNEVCPMTFVKTKLKIEGMKPGEVLEVRLKGEEPLRNVPRSVEEHGHSLISLSPEGDDDSVDGIHRLVVRKN